MIARAKRGQGFTNLARYLETGREGDSSDRVVWTEARNLPTNDPHTAGVIMRATATQSARTEKPVYHIALSFDPDDAVDRATMVQVADRLMNDLGIREHQALIMAHGDTRHPHLHLMINRVHPETFRAWDPKNDYRQIERSLRKQERELGLRAVPGHHYRLEGQEQRGRSAEHPSTGKIPNPSRIMDHQPERRADYPAESRLHDENRPTPDRARPETTEAPARDRSQPTEGHQAPERVDTTESRETAVSRSREDLRADQVRDRGQQAESRPHDQSPPAPEPSADIAAARARVEAFWRHAVRDLYEAKSWEDVTQRMVDKGLWGQEGTRPGSPAEQAGKDLELLGGHVEIDFRDIVDGRQPRFAADRGLDNQRTSAERPGTDARPEATGPGAPTAGQSHQRAADPSDRANAGRRDTRPSSSRALDPRLDRVRQSINHLDQRIQLERTRGRAVDDLDRARVRLIPYTAQRAQAHQASERFRAALREVYRDPVAARRTFHAQTARIGGPAAAAELRRHPDRFGQLRGTQLGPVRSAERAAAVQAVPKLEHLGKEHPHRVREAWANRAEYRGTRATVVRLERQIKKLDAELERSPRRAQLEQRLAGQLRALQPRQRQSLYRSLPKPQRALVGGAIMLAREFAREQGHER